MKYLIKIILFTLIYNSTLYSYNEVFEDEPLNPQCSNLVSRELLSPNSFKYTIMFDPDKQNCFGEVPHKFARYPNGTIYEVLELVGERADGKGQFINPYYHCYTETYKLTYEDVPKSCPSIDMAFDYDKCSCDCIADNEEYDLDLNECVCKSPNYELHGYCISPQDSCPDGYTKDFNGICFADSDGDGIPDDVDDNSNADAKCTGYSNENIILIPFTTNYQPSDFSYLGVKQKGLCDEFINRSDIDAVMIKNDNNLGCPNEYCFVHYLTSDCWKLKPSDYYPSSEWIYTSVYNEAQCNSYISSDDYVDTYYIKPNPDCKEQFCYLLPNNETDNTDANNTRNPIQLDENSSQIMQDLSPLLDATNQSNEILKVANNQRDKTNQKLDGLIEKVTESNRYSAEQISEIKGLSNKIDNEGIKARIDNSNIKLEAINQSLISNTIATNSGFGVSNELLQKIADNTSDINKSGSDINITIDLGSVATSDFDNSMLSMDGIISEYTQFGDNLQQQVSSVQNTIDTAQSLLDQGITVAPHIKTTSCNEPFILHGKHYDFDPCQTISPYSNLLYSLTYLVGLASIAMTAFTLLFGGL